jgi:DUF1365 family protein
VAFVFVPLLLAAVTVFRAAMAKAPTKTFQSALYVGKVWHTRFHPKVHAFSYPIFMFALDLEEVDSLADRLWPLNVIMSFRETDHLINGEGLLEKTETNTSNSLANRILRLVAEKTNQKFQPSLDTHRIVLMTHLSYFGYNFNPVSFYYIIEKQSNGQEEKITAIVGEVSNTPWSEMHCYVLHPDSVDKVECPTIPEPKKEQPALPSIHCIFPKQFHVSPFMEMDYLYDWSFTGIPKFQQQGNSSTLIVINTLRRQDRIHFTAKLKVEPRSLNHPLRLAWQMIRFPVYCLIIQIWIHYEAARLFLKGIAYVPHPAGSETTVSRIIANIMTPFFALRDRWDPKSKQA